MTRRKVLGPAPQGLSFVFSGDTAPCPALEQAAQGADLLLCDATYALPEQAAQAKQYGHSTFGQSAALAAKAGAAALARPLFAHDHRPGRRACPGAEPLPGGRVRL